MAWRISSAGPLKQMMCASEAAAVEEYIMVGRCRLTVSNPSRKRAWFQQLKLKCDEPLSNFAFNFNLRRYIMGQMRAGVTPTPTEAAVDACGAGAYTRSQSSST